MIQYHWHNRGYENREDWLRCLPSKRRTQIRRESREPKKQGITIRTVRAPELSRDPVHWAEHTHRLYRANTEKHFWGGAYLNLAFFQRLFEDLADHEGVVLVLGDGLDDQPEGFAPNAALVVYLGAYTSSALASADFQFPVTTFAEQEGTFTNHAGRVQRFWPALSGPGAARPAWLVLGALSGALKEEEGPTRVEQAFGLVAKAGKSYKELDYETIGAQGGLSRARVPVPGD